MESVFHHLGEFARFVVEQWMWLSLLGALLLLVWYRRATSPLPARRPSFARR
jgi:hypothetical protein